MSNWIRNYFSLTENGAKGSARASYAAFFKFFAYMSPMLLLMYFVQTNLEGTPKSMSFYLIGIVVTCALMYILINIAYHTTFNETYKEAANLRIEIANTLKELPLSYFSKHNLSDLSQTLMQDVADIEHAMSHAIPEMIGFGLYFVFMCVLLLMGNVKLGLAVLVPIAASAFFLFLSKRMQVKATTKYFYKLRNNADAFQEAIEMQQEIKSYGRKASVVANIHRAIDETEKLHIETEVMQAIPVTLSSSVVRFSLGLTVMVGSLLYLNGEVPLIYVIGYTIAATKLMDAVAAVYANIAEVMYIDARIERIRELRNTKVQQGEPYEIRNYDIEFKDVRFGYDEENTVVDGVSFTMKQNEVTALVGPSGCGKTTVLRLLSRLYDYDTGEILIDGRDIKSIDTDSLFDKISIVFQDVSLFNTSVLENIRIGRKEASDEEVIRAAQYANCMEFIEKLPEGFHTLVGENGMKLSGGERQRISIARAILKDAPIILLDEISASLDVENEMKIQESLNHLIRNKTVVIISHRLKSIENANKIIVMNKGKVDAIGTHEELLRSSKLYQTMVSRSNMTEAYRY